MISLGARLTLIKVVFIVIPVFWFSMAQIMKDILIIMRRNMFTFFWSRKNDGGNYHLANWEILSKQKKWGSWNIKSLHWFSITLNMKILWRGLFGKRFVV